MSTPARGALRRADLVASAGAAILSSSPRTPTASSTPTRTTRRPSRRDSSTIDGHLYESTGLEGTPLCAWKTSKPAASCNSSDVPDKYFAEGLTDWGNTLIQLTWQSHIALVYDRSTFRLLRTFNYDGEGWGLTHDAQESDPQRRHRDASLPRSRNLPRNPPHHGHRPRHARHQLNELEFIHGEIYANIWHADRIARISPATGKVIGWIDLPACFPPSQHIDPEAVLNGIAYDAAHDRLFVTGKLWPKLFEIKIAPRSKP